MSASSRVSMACASKIGCEISAMTSSPVPLAADDAVRVAVGSLTGRRSGAWRIWFGPQDIFAGYRSVAYIRKASIHYERPENPTQLRYIGYTSEWEKSQGRSTRLKDRAHQFWNGTTSSSSVSVSPNANSASSLQTNRRRPTGSLHPHPLARQRFASSLPESLPSYTPVVTCGCRTTSLAEPDVERERGELRTLRLGHCESGRWLLQRQF
jgi:hypothetical protein